MNVWLVGVIGYFCFNLILTIFIFLEALDEDVGPKIISFAKNGRKRFLDITLVGTILILFGLPVFVGMLCWFIAIDFIPEIFKGFCTLPKILSDAISEVFTHKS